MTAPPVRLGFAVVLYVTLTLGAASPSAAQASESDRATDSLAVLVVESATPEARVMLEAEPLGAVAEGPFRVRAGAYTLSLHEPPATWQGRRAMRDVRLVAGETLRVALDLPVRYRIESVPPGATVTLDGADGRRRTMGTAPLTIDEPEPAAGTFVVELPGYAPAHLTPGDSAMNAHTVALRPLAPGQVQGPAQAWAPRRSAGRWVDVAAGAAALVGMGVAAHFKLRADAVDDRYRDEDSFERGNPERSDDSRRQHVNQEGRRFVQQRT